MTANQTQGSGRCIAVAQALPCCVLLVCQMASAGGSSATTAPDVRAVDPDIGQALASLAAAVGPEYVELRTGFLSEGGERACNVIRDSLPGIPDGPLRLTSSILLRWCASERECVAFHDTFAALLKSSYGTVSGDPSRERIGGGCLRHWRAGNDDELLLLEKLLKYDDPPHAKSGIITALGAMGTEESLVPLLELIKSDEHPSYSGVCAMAAAKISKRVGDKRVVRDIVTVYAKRPPSRGTGLPEDQLRRMPPWPHVELILALSQLDGEEALKALEELRRTETDPVLVESLDNAKRSMQKRIDEKVKAPAP